MSTETLISRYEQQLAAFETHFMRSYEGLQEEDVHQLRVAIKNLRSLLKLMEVISGGDFDKEEHYQLFQRLFKKAGKLRETHMNRYLIEQYDPDIVRPYRDYLNAKESKAAKKLLEEIPRFQSHELHRLNAKMKSSIRPLDDHEVIMYTKIFVAQKLMKVRRLRESATDDHHLHQLRMQLKQALETIALMNAYEDVEVSEEMEKEVRILAKRIGKWHDMKVLIDSLSEFQAKHPKTKKLKQLIKVVKRQNRTNRDQILHLLLDCDLPHTPVTLLR